ncbi:MAG: hypothetical protein M1132_07595 [Chloroflexi bacterium]|nr:hypothetical protein [Chloroflexota bacterium]
MSHQAVYQERFTRIQKAMHVEAVDRVPIIYMGSAFVPRYMGMSMAQFCSDREAAFRVKLTAMDKLAGFDGANQAGSSGGISLVPLWLSRVEIPGRELPADSLWQVREAQVMLEAEYDTILHKGWSRFLADYMPRVVDVAQLDAFVLWSSANRQRILETYREHGTRNFMRKCYRNEIVTSRENVTETEFVTSHRNVTPAGSA